MPDDPLEPCYIAAMRILNYRFNSEAELRRKLRRKQFEKDVIDATVERLRRETWLDDERFAGAFVRTRALKRIGARRIGRELESAGVDAGTAAKAVADNVDPEREREDVNALCETRFRLLARRRGDAYVRTPEARAKVAAWLMGRGYNDTIVREAIRTVLAKTPQPEE